LEFSMVCERSMLLQVNNWYLEELWIQIMYLLH
jgi:hypothetical protein